MTSESKRKDDIIKNAAFSFKAEGCNVTSATLKDALDILSGQKSATAIINEYARAYKNKAQEND